MGDDSYNFDTASAARLIAAVRGTLGQKISAVDLPRQRLDGPAIQIFPAAITGPGTTALGGYAFHETSGSGGQIPEYSGYPYSGGADGIVGDGTTLAGTAFALGGDAPAPFGPAATYSSSPLQTNAAFVTQSVLMFRIVDSAGNPWQFFVRTPGTDGLLNYVSLVAIATTPGVGDAPPTYSASDINTGTVYDANAKPTGATGIDAAPYNQNVGAYSLYSGSDPASPVAIPFSPAGYSGDAAPDQTWEIDDNGLCTGVSS